MNDVTSKAPWHLRAVAVIAVLFNSIGVFDFVMSRTQGAQYMALRHDARSDRPLRGHAGLDAGRVGHRVFGALLASILLLMRRKLAFVTFVLSLAAFLVSLLHTYALTDGGEIMGSQMAIFSAVIAGLLAFFACYSRLLTARGVLS